MYAIFETLVVAAIIAFSVWQLARMLFPKMVGGKRDAGGGCGSGGCNACKSCATFTFDPAAEPVPPRTSR